MTKSEHHSKSRGWHLLASVCMGLVMLIFFFPSHAFSKDLSGPSEHAKNETVTKAAEKVPTTPISKTTDLQLEGLNISVKATAGEIPIRLKENDEAKARIFFVAYEKDCSDRISRPVTFLFNGGPGASSVWLHLGGVGPFRIKMRENGTLLPPPSQLIENSETWLPFTDLVFVDPVGTGFSRGEPDNAKTAKPFFEFRKDIEAAAEFIRLYLNQSGRWGSPLFLAGESYGSTRVANLALSLNERYGVTLNGLVLISTVLDFATILPFSSSELSYVLCLPSYTASAWYHNRLPSIQQKMDLLTLLNQVEGFCIDEYLNLLARGDNLSEIEKEKLCSRLHEFTGLSKNLILEHRFRIPTPVFTKNLLKSETKLIGRMDTTVSGPDPYPSHPYSAYDPSLSPLYGYFAGAMNGYVREVLGFETDLPYEFLNPKVNSRWDWAGGLKQKQGFVDVSNDLLEIMSLNKNLKVLILGGLYDLATPYMAVTYTLNHLWLGSLRKNITRKNYKSGHMMYTRRAVLEALTRDVREFYCEALKTGAM